MSALPKPDWSCSWTVVGTSALYIDRWIGNCLVRVTIFLYIYSFCIYTLFQTVCRRTVIHRAILLEVSGDLIKVVPSSTWCLFTTDSTIHSCCGESVLTLILIGLHFMKTLHSHLFSASQLIISIVISFYLSSSFQSDIWLYVICGLTDHYRQRCLLCISDA